MIGRLRGTIASAAADGTVVLDVHGVGYEVLVPLGTTGRLAQSEGGVVTLMVHTNVREDAITLFGFADDRERSAFRVLIGVAGVGPRTAVAILGMLPASDLVTVIARNDVKKLQAVPGIGKRIAERLCLELKDKLTLVALGIAGGVAAVPAANSVASAGAGAAGTSGLERVVETLMRMGFKQAEADRAVAELKGREGEALDVLTRDALRSLMP